MDSSPFTAGVARARKSYERFVSRLRRGAVSSQASMGQLARDVGAIDQQLTALGKVAAITTLANAFVQLSAAVAPAAGAIGVLPALLASAGAAFATVKIATAGMGDAMKAVAEGDAAKLKEAMADLAPSAREFVRSFGRIGKAFDPIRKAVQQRLFVGLGAAMERAATANLPTLQAGLERIAARFNQMGHAAARAASQPWFTGALDRSLSATSAAMGHLGQAVEPLMRIMAALTDAGNRYIVQLAKWVSGGIQAAAAFLRTEAGARKLQRAIDAGVAALGKIWAIAVNLGSALVGIFRAANASAGSMLDTLEKGTAAFARWANSARGQRQLVDLFKALGEFLGALIPVLGTVSNVMLKLAGAFNRLPAPLRNIIASTAAWTLVLGILLGKVVAAGGGIRLMVGAVVKLLRFLRLIPPATTAAAAANTALAASNARTGWSFTAAAAAAFRWSVATVAAFARTVAAAALSTVMIIAGLVRIGIAWIVSAARAMASAVVMAAAWLIALGPVGWVIAAVLAVVAIFAVLWVKSEAFRNFWKGLWKDIQGVAGDVGNWFKGPFVQFWQGAWQGVQNASGAAWRAITGQTKQGSSTMQRIVGALTRIMLAIMTGGLSELVRAVVGNWDTIVGFFKAAPGRIVRALGNLGGLLVRAGKALIQGLWRGIQAAWGWVRDKLNWIKNQIPDWKGPLSDDYRLLQPAGRALMDGLIGGIDDRMGMLRSVLADVTRQVDADLAALDKRVEFAMNAAADPNRGRAGYVQAEDGSWVPRSFYGGGSNVTVNIMSPYDREDSGSVQRRLARLADLGAFEGAAA